MMPAHLKEDQGEQEAAVGSVMTEAAADGIAQDGQVFQVAKPEAGQAKFGCMAAGTNHSCTTIRAFRHEIQRAPTEELLPGMEVRCTVLVSMFHKE